MDLALADTHFQKSRFIHDFEESEDDSFAHRISRVKAEIAPVYFLVEIGHVGKREGVDGDGESLRVREKRKTF